MNADLSYLYTALRYEHDVRTEEFLNVGVLFWVPESGFIEFVHTRHSHRLAGAFGDVNAAEIINSLYELKSKLISLDLPKSRTGSHEDLMSIAHRALPPDDSSFKWSSPSAGFAPDPRATLERVFQRLVTRYERRPEKRVRGDRELWRNLEARLRPQGVLKYFSQKTIRAPLRPYRFDHVWQNELAHVIVPIALDGADETAIADKAIKWAGQITDLQRAQEWFRLHLILGEPVSKSLSSEYEKAVGFLTDRADSRRTEIVPSNELSHFADRTVEEIKAHIKASERPKLAD